MMVSKVMNPPDRACMLRPGTVNPPRDASTGLAPGRRSDFDVGDSRAAYSAVMEFPAARHHAPVRRNVVIALTPVPAQ